jgi:F-type H+-transporting ATPase subunit a
VFALEFPPINEILRWREVAPSLNKVGLIAVAAALIAIVVFILATRQDHRKAPTGVRNFAETTVEFVENGIVMQTMGRDGLGWTPFLLSLFVFIYLCNAPGVIPILQMPATARMAIPAFLSILVWVIYNGVGIKHQGFGGYFKSVLFPPGVPKALYALVTPIEFISTIIVRPFSLMVRLFANMLAGHILLVTFASARQNSRTLRRIADVHVDLPHRIRGVGCVPAGIHLHDPHRRIHRWRGTFGALRRKQVRDLPKPTTHRRKKKWKHLHDLPRRPLRLPKPLQMKRTLQLRRQPVSRMALQPSDPALASVTSWVRPFRQWLVSPKQLAWFVPRCSSVSHLPKRLRLSDSWCSSFSSSPEIRRTLKESHYPSNAAQELTC